MMLSGCGKDNDKDGDDGDFPTKQLAEWGLTIKKPAGYNAFFGWSYVGPIKSDGTEGYSVYFYGNASTGAAVKKAFTDSGWINPVVENFDGYTKTSYSKTGYVIGYLEETIDEDGDYGFKIYIERPEK